MVNKKDAIPGLVFLAVGGFFLVNALFFIRTGRSDTIGPSTFPAILAAMLFGIGIVVLVRSLFARRGEVKLIDWWRLATVLLAPVAFGLLVRGAGMLPALVLSVGLGTFADTQASWLRRGLIVAGITGVCLLVFTYGLRLPYPVLGPWFRWAGG